MSGKYNLPANRIIKDTGKWEITTADGIFIKMMEIKQAGTYVPQHSHTWEHASLLSTGAVKLWKDGVLIGNFEAPHLFTIEANVKHLFMSTKPNTVIFCIHNVSRTGEVDVAEENIPKVDKSHVILS